MHVEHFSLESRRVEFAEVVNVAFGLVKSYTLGRESFGYSRERFTAAIGRCFERALILIVFGGEPF